MIGARMRRAASGVLGDAPGDWSPLDLPNLEGWWDASDAATITDTTGDVSQLDDKSGNGRHLAQATGSLQPRTGDSTRNGLNVLDFNADELQAATVAPWKFMHDGTRYHVFMVVSPANAAGSTARYVMLGTAWETTHHGVFFAYDDRAYGSGSDKIQNIVHRNSSSVAVSNVTGSVLPAATWSVWDARMAPSDATVADRSDIRVDDGTAQKNNDNSATPSSSNPTSPLKLGGSATSTDRYVGGFAELVLCSADLSTSARGDALAYLQSKWGI